MTEATLLALATTSRVLFTDDFLAGRTKPDFRDHVVDPGLDRAVDLAGLDAVIHQAMYDERYAGEASSSDSWLAPRVHAALRLRRSEAADRRLWTWLAVVRYDDYVRWRFPPDPATPVKRFIGQDRDNALSRLWWGAELTRDGSDYSATVRAFEKQDIPNTWFSIDAFHNRAAALAAMRMLPRMGGRPINRLSTAFNHFLTTIMLDTVAPLPGPDRVAIDEWVSGATSVDELLLDELPPGPDEDPVDPVLVDEVERLVRRVADEVGIQLGPES
jgi:Family of unknown function (DUF6339)